VDEMRRVLFAALLRVEHEQVTHAGRHLAGQL